VAYIKASVIATETDDTAAAKIQAVNEDEIDLMTEIN
jgi:hypothetical protein